MSMSKTEIIQRCKIKLTEVKQSATAKIEEDINIALKWLGEEETRIAKEGLTNGTVTKPLVEVEMVTEGKPDRE